MPDIRDLLAGAADEPTGPFDPETIRRRVQQRARRRRAAGGLAAVVVVASGAIGLAALQDDDSPDQQIVAGDPESTTTTVEPGTSMETTTVPPTTTSETTGTTGVPAAIEDGRHFGYAVSYERDGSSDVMRFDLAQLFTGDEADAAAAEDGVIAEGEQIENDVYIRNTNTRLRDLRLAGDAAITVIDCDAGCEPVAADLGALQGRPVPTPVWVTVTGGVVVAAEEMYLP
jgi:hypothetical protein